MADTTQKTSSGNKVWSLIDGFAGDRVILMIVLILIMFSILAISSSTSLLANQLRTQRTDIIREQFIIAAAGLGIMFLIYRFKPKFFRFISQFGFVVSLFLLLLLIVRIDIPHVIKALKINDAVRSLSIFGFQLHVYEFVKILMVMYLGWAVQTYKNDNFAIANLLAKTDTFAFMGSNFAKKCFYIYGPILLVCLLTMDGSISSALFVGLIMGATILVGGIGIKELIPVILAGMVLIGVIVGVYFISGGTKFERVGTGISRITKFSSDNEKEILQYKEGTVAFRDALDKNRQALGAKLAIKEGIIPKGPGHSTQKYTVPVIFEDYMFAFIIEEYGIIGALVILLLYGSLLARGSRIVKFCDTVYAKTVVAGLTLLISGQALMHMLINVDLAPMTGQTLPLISHGNSSFLAFSIAFGIILSVSRSAEKKLLSEQMRIAPALETPEGEEEEEQQQWVSSYSAGTEEGDSSPIRVLEGNEEAEEEEYDDDEPEEEEEE